MVATIKRIDKSIARLAHFRKPGAFVACSGCRFLSRAVQQVYRDTEALLRKQARNWKI